MILSLHEHNDKTHNSENKKEISISTPTGMQGARVSLSPGDVKVADKHQCWAAPQSVPIAVPSLNFPAWASVSSGIQF